MSTVEQPDYQLITSEDNIEIRDYSPMILAEVQVCGERKAAIREGFKILADYIFGNNTCHLKIDSTTPVTGELNEKIAMTAPVMQEKHMDQWKVRFVMPKKYNFQTLPKPNCKKVMLIASPARRFAVIRFSGFAKQENINHHIHLLQAFILEKNLERWGGIILAFYNPPWTLPFLRRNEIMIEIKRDG